MVEEIPLKVLANSVVSKDRMLEHGLAPQVGDLKSESTMRPMVNGERLVLSTLLAGIYLPGIEELYLSSRKKTKARGSSSGTKEAPPLYNIGGAISPQYASIADLLSEGLDEPAQASPPTGLFSDAGRAEGPRGPVSFQEGIVKESPLPYGARRVIELLKEKLPSPAEAPDLLRRHGLASAALRLENTGLMALVRQLAVEGSFLTPFHPEAEWIWEGGASLPPALWCVRPQTDFRPCEFPRRLFAVVGSREVDLLGAKGAKAAARALHQGGWTLVTGGARGVDVLALEEVAESLTPRGVVLHPSGLSSLGGKKLRNRFPWAWHLSLCPPWQGFEGRCAHQRNRIIFALSEGAISISPRLRRGGTWSGAVECLRGRLAPLAVMAGTGDPEAAAALKNLGAAEVCLEELLGSGGQDFMTRLAAKGRSQAGSSLQAALFEAANFGSTAVLSSLKSGVRPASKGSLWAGAGQEISGIEPGCDRHDSCLEDQTDLRKNLVKESVSRYGYDRKRVREAALAGCSTL